MTARKTGDWCQYQVKNVAVGILVKCLLKSLALWEAFVTPVICTPADIYGPLKLLDKKLLDKKRR